MFENYEKYLKSYEEYLLTLNSEMNSSEMDSTFSTHETIIEHVYKRQLNYKYSVKYSALNDNMVLFDFSIGADKTYDELKLKTLGMYLHKEFSLVDTLYSIKNFVRLGNAAYVFTDYGLIKLYGYNTEANAIVKISEIFVWLDSKEHKDVIEKFINDTIVPIPDKNIQKNLSVCTCSNYGFSTQTIEVKPFDCDITKNYNDDMPYDKINELINSDTEELILLHGEPGTGKTSIIKKLIYDNPTTEFIYFDFKLLTSFSDTRIFEFLSDHKQHVFIIEDCEKLFINRNNGNDFLNSMLNLTDGIIGEAFGVKFVCTFNCPPSQIDKAIMREGRLSLIYEFKKLTLEKTQALLPTASEPMTLAQIYHTEDNGNKKERKMGF